MSCFQRFGSTFNAAKQYGREARVMPASPDGVDYGNIFLRDEVELALSRLRNLHLQRYRSRGGGFLKAAVKSDRKWLVLLDNISGKT